MKTIGNKMIPLTPANRALDARIDKLAEKLALDFVNNARSARGLKPLRTVRPLMGLWWSLRGDEFVRLARKQIKSAKN